MVHASELKLPEGAKLLSPGEKIVVECVLPLLTPEGEAIPARDGVEPEVIGRKKEEGEEEA